MTLAQLESQAKDSASRYRTGSAHHGVVMVKYYPSLSRFRWFDRTGPIDRSTAERILRMMNLTVVKP